MEGLADPEMEKDGAGGGYTRALYKYYSYENQNGVTVAKRAPLKWSRDASEQV